MGGFGPCALGKQGRRPLCTGQPGPEVPVHWARGPCALGRRSLRAGALGRRPWRTGALGRGLWRTGPRALARWYTGPQALVHWTRSTGALPTPASQGLGHWALAPGLGELGLCAAGEEISLAQWAAAPRRSGQGSAGLGGSSGALGQRRRRTGRRAPQALAHWGGCAQGAGALHTAPALTPVARLIRATEIGETLPGRSSARTVL